MMGASASWAACPIADNGVMRIVAAVASSGADAVWVSLGNG
jgi:hypothetical protein